jgi:gliding motility-associated lipoprotein GldD
MKAILIIVGVLLMVACTEESYTPKPPTYLRLELPEPTYSKYDDSCAYNFNLSQLYEVTNAPDQMEGTCHKRIDLGPLNGMAYIRYWDMSQPLAFYVNSANDEIDKHKLKADNIINETIIRPDDRVFGSFFELQGDVATPFQFYLTDSTTRFLYCEVLFNSTPNYDSLRPTLDYLKRDLDEFVNTLDWE